jgi:hypothetical protein
MGSMNCGPVNTFHAEIEPDHIALFDDGEELIYWDAVEWREDPELVVIIANAINIGHTEGADGVRVRLIAGS